jgi:hypothetical protein
MFDKFTTYNQSEYREVLKMDALPIFTNKTYNSYEEAIVCNTGTVNLVQSLISGFIYNLDFDPEKMEYDSNYNNEQGYSNTFLNHLNDVADIIYNEVDTNSKIIEIGCGKGLFLNKLKNEGLDIVGFDPTYEGLNDSITKDYFSAKYSTKGDFLILRHTLEHIKDPFSFLHVIAKANNYLGKIYIEVPTFDWIIERSAFWDITYEHCNYFTVESLSTMFSKSTTGKLFGDQYIYIIANLSDLKSDISQQNINTYDTSKFFNKILSYQRQFEFMNDLAIWGGATKGLLFLNQIDPKNDKIKYVIDLNPAKQNRFMAKSGHKIFSPSIIEKSCIKNVIVSNENYFNEINDSLSKFDINVLKLE